jgi:hypothetical protein
MVTALLMITVIVMYHSIIGGVNGTKQRVIDSGGEISHSISRMNP